MFVILSYDMNRKRTTKAMKICRRYLQHRHESVFEGMISDKKLKELKRDLHEMIVPEEDSIIIYEFSTLRYTCKEYLGQQTLPDGII